MLEGGIRPARRSVLAEDVATSIRQAIFDGSIDGGRLSDAELAQQLGVSRGPVREALLRLQQEGIVEIAPHRGASVATFTATDVYELASLRTALEVFAAELAVERATESDFAAMAEVTRAFAPAAAAGDDLKVVRLDMQFHDALYRAAHHSRLWNAWAGMRSQVTLFLFKRRSASDDYGQLAAIEHQEILDVLMSRDIEQVRHMVEQHLRGSYDRLSRPFAVECAAAVATLSSVQTPAVSGGPGMGERA
ncbi:MAG: GntR family transcriptional regulator [Dactylosporangium sp.]|jgi:DNA-binding GntR family transcriptional regulator|nr:GntR family transcriptional regulator [Dactylosporangium sp.]